MSASSAELARETARPAVLTRGRSGTNSRSRVFVAVILLAALLENAGAAGVGAASTTSVGLIAALASVLVVKSWSTQMPVDAFPLFASLAFGAGAAVWAWRGRLSRHVLAFIASPAVFRQKRSAAISSAAVTRGASEIALPPGVCQKRLLAGLEAHFASLQAAWDRCDLPALRSLTTDEMLAELCEGRADCLAPRGAAGSEVLSLRTELLGYEALSEADLVSVEFSGWVRDGAGGVAVPFREVWMLMAARGAEDAWRLARHHALL